MGSIKRAQKQKERDDDKDTFMGMEQRGENYEIRIRSSWQGISHKDQKTVFTKINELLSLLEKLDKKNVKHRNKEPKIEVEFDDGKAEVEIKTSGKKEKFILNTTDKEAVLSEINKRTGIKMNKLRAIVEFEEDD